MYWTINPILTLLNEEAGAAERKAHWNPVVSFSPSTNTGEKPLGKSFKDMTSQNERFAEKNKTTNKGLFTYILIKITPTYYTDFNA